MRQKVYQSVGSLFLASRKNAILADEMGLGKTNQAVCAIDLLSMDLNVDRVLIISPAIVRPQWDAQLAQWLICHNQHPVQQIEKTDDIIEGKTVIVSYNLINCPAILNQLISIDWDVIIYDEFHYMKNVDAKRTINILGKDGIVTKSKHNWFLSGTPVTSKPADLFPILITIARKKLHPYTTWVKYIKHFCNAYKDDFGRWAHHGSSNLDELSTKLRPVMLRRLVKDVEPNLKEPLCEKVILALPDKQQYLYDIEIEQFEDLVYSSTQERNVLAGMKGETIYEHLKLVIGNEQKVVVFYHHKILGRYLKARLGEKSFMIDGSTSVKKRSGIIKDFVSNKYGVLLAQSTASGTGVDGLQHGCNTCYFAEIPWNPDIRDQNIRRLLRMGQSKKVKVFFPVVRDTVDEKIYDSWFRKENIINTILEGNKNVRKFD